MKRARGSFQTSSRCGLAIANQNRKEFFGDGEDMAACFVREAIVENPGFQRPRGIALRTMSAAEVWRK